MHKKFEERVATHDNISLGTLVVDRSGRALAEADHALVLAPTPIRTLHLDNLVTNETNAVVHILLLELGVTNVVRLHCKYENVATHLIHLTVQDLMHVLQASQLAQVYLL